MPEWKLWRDMAIDSFQAGRTLQGVSDRGAVNRFYYAAYQICTAFLLYRNLQPPQEREAWSHAETPELFEEALIRIISSRDKRRELRRRLELLYTVRCYADYASEYSITVRDAELARKDAGHILRVIEEALQGA